MENFVHTMVILLQIVFSIYEILLFLSIKFSTLMGSSTLRQSCLGMGDPRFILSMPNTQSLFWINGYKGFRCIYMYINLTSICFLLFWYEGLVKLVEEAVRLEHSSSPNKPIYLLGESFGGCLALAVAARNPTIDLVVILVNPG